MRIVQTCVESRLLYDCQARVWYERHIRTCRRAKGVGGWDGEGGAPRVRERGRVGRLRLCI